MLRWCYRLNCAPPNSYEALTPIAAGGRACRKSLQLPEIARVGLRQPASPHSVGCAWFVVSGVGPRLGGKPREEASAGRHV